MIQSKDALVVGLERLEKEDFYEERNRPVFWALRELYERGIAVDRAILADHLSKTPSPSGKSSMLDVVGGRLRLIEIIEDYVTDKRVEYHAFIVKEKSTRRKLIEIGREITASAQNEFKKIEETIVESENKLLSCAGVGGGGAKAGQIDFLARFDQQHGQTILTGLEDLDRHTGGLNRGEPCIVAARPSVGKTALGLQICRYCAGAAHKIIYYTYETTKKVLEDRLVVSALAIDRYRWKTRRLLPDELKKFAEATSPPDEQNPGWGALLKIQQNLLIEESRPDYRKFALSLKLHYARFPFDLVIVDYVQNMALKETNQDVADAFKALGDAAARHNVPVIALSQLHRLETTPGNRYDPKPRLTDLRQSGTLEQGGRVVLLLWNKTASLRSSMPTDLTPTERTTMEEWKNKCRFILAKNSEGDVAEWEMGWDGKTGRFHSLDTIHKEVPF